MTPGGIFDAVDAEITTWGRADLSRCRTMETLVLRAHLQRLLRLLTKFVRVLEKRLLLIHLMKQLITSWTNY